MRLIHYSANPLGDLKVINQIAPAHYFDKPKGLWVSVEGEGDWKSWCEAESFGTTRMQFENVIELDPDAAIIRVCGAYQLIEFTKEYGIVSEMAKIEPIFARSLAIDWPRVASQHQGVIIAPYQWSLRLDTFTSWYYGWDCASGCIWDVSAIRSISSTRLEGTEDADSERKQEEVSEGLARD